MCNNWRDVIYSNKPSLKIGWEIVCNVHSNNKCLNKELKIITYGAVMLELVNHLGTVSMYVYSGLGLGLGLWFMPP